MLRIAVCDDESIHRTLLSDALASFAMRYDVDYTITYYASSAQLLEAPSHYQLLFLDVWLENDINGIDVAMQLRQRHNCCAIILVTATPSFVLEGYKIRAFRYLLKPIDQAEFDEAICACMQELTQTARIIQVQCGHGSHLIAVHDLILIESYRRKRILYVEDRRVETAESWKVLMEKLPTGQFFAVQKSFVINLAHVICADRSTVQMKNKREIPIARGRADEFAKALRAYVGGLV